MANTSTDFVTLPFLTLPDPPESGEGAIDSLGMATIADRLADWVLPGMTARMSRPRFLTAIAVSAVVCEGFEDELSVDGITPSYLVFEWIVVEAFARMAEREDVRRTPGIEKASRARHLKIPLSAKTYLKTASVFGFHGMYKRLAQHIGIVDDEFRLGDAGYSLVKTWEKEQGIAGFLESALGDGEGGRLRRSLRSAVEAGLEKGHTDRSGGWEGWAFLAERLAPAKLRKNEAEHLRTLLTDPNAETRGEVFGLVDTPEHLDAELSEAELVDRLFSRCSEELATRLRCIAAYERVCRPIEDAFDWLRYKSTRAGARTTSSLEFAGIGAVQRAVTDLGEALAEADRILAPAPLQIQQQFTEFAKFFDSVRDGASLYDAILDRHAVVQKAKPPEGKRQWFEHGADGSVMVRIPYRVDDPPATDRSWWSRPYRLDAVRSFCRDLH